MISWSAPFTLFFLAFVCSCRQVLVSFIGIIYLTSNISTTTNWTNVFFLARCKSKPNGSTRISLIFPCRCFLICFITWCRCIEQWRERRQTDHVLQVKHYIHVSSRNISFPELIFLSRVISHNPRWIIGMRRAWLVFPVSPIKHKHCHSFS